MARAGGPINARAAQVVPPGNGVALTFLNGLGDPSAGDIRTELFALAPGAGAASGPSSSSSIAGSTTMSGSRRSAGTWYAATPA